MENSVTIVLALISLLELAARAGDYAPYTFLNIVDALLNMIYVMFKSDETPIADKDYERIADAIDLYLWGKNPNAVFIGKIFGSLARIYLTNRKLTPTPRIIEFLEKYANMPFPRHEEPVSINFCRRALNWPEYQGYEMERMMPKEWWLPSEIANKINYQHPAFKEEKAEWESL